MHAALILAALGALAIVAYFLAPSAKAAMANDGGAGAPADTGPSALDAIAAAIASTPNPIPAGTEGIAGSVESAPIAYTPPASAAPYVDDIARAEQINGLPAGLLARVLYQESRYRPEIITGAVKSPAGAVGIAQFMPATARDFGIDPTNASQSIAAAGRYLAQLYRITGDWPSALASYNWGVGNVQRRGLAAAPEETQKYVAQILADSPNAKG